MRTRVQRRVAQRMTILLVVALSTLGALVAPAVLVHTAELITLVGGNKRTLPDEATNPTVSF